MRQLHKRIPHIMTNKKGIHHPSNFMFFDTETINTYKGKDKDIEQHQLDFGCIWAFRYEQKQVTRSKKATFKNKDQYYSLIKSRLDKKRPLYLVAHNLGFDLTIVDWWDYAEHLGMNCLYAILEDPPLFMSYQWYGCKIIIVDTFNYWKCSVADMGKALNIPKLEIDLKKATFKAKEKYCQRDVEIIAKQVINLLDFLTDNDLGTFGISAPTIAMNTFKKRFMKHEIFIHDRVKVLQLERDCYYGGLVNNFYIGKSRGELLYYVDVNSLYPSVMVNSYPTKLLGSYKDIQPKNVDIYDPQIGYCADCEIQTMLETYPMRYQKRLCEVRGKFRTKICGPEFLKALQNKHVKHIYHLSMYTLEPIFKDYVEHLWLLRQRFREPKGNPQEQLIKLLLNSLYGKFGMKGFDWKDFNYTNMENYYDLMSVPFPDEYKKGITDPIMDNHIMLWYPINLNTPVKLRYLSGKLQMQFPTGEHTESFCGIAAFVTSYARERLRQLIKIAGKQQTYYCDTDSLFVSTLGHQRLAQAKELDQHQLGKLKIESVSSTWGFFGPKDYYFGNKHVLKGIKKNAKQVSPGVFEQLQFEGLKSVLNRGAKPYIEIRTIIKHNHRNYAKGLLTRSGWTLPFTLS